MGRREREKQLLPVTLVAAVLGAVLPLVPTVSVGMLPLALRASALSPELQQPVHHRRRVAVSCLQVGLSDGQVLVDHRQRLVPQDALQGKDIAAVPQKRNSEGVAEAMGIDIFHSCPCP